MDNMIQSGLHLNDMVFNDPGNVVALNEQVRRHRWGDLDWDIDKWSSSLKPILGLAATTNAVVTDYLINPLNQLTPITMIHRHEKGIYALGRNQVTRYDSDMNMLVNLPLGLNLILTIDRVYFSDNHMYVLSSPHYTLLAPNNNAVVNFHVVEYDLITLQQTRTFGRGETAATLGLSLANERVIFTSIGPTGFYLFAMHAETLAANEARQVIIRRVDFDGVVTSSSTTFSSGNRASALRFTPGVLNRLTQTRHHVCLPLFVNTPTTLPARNEALIINALTLENLGATTGDIGVADIGASGQGGLEWTVTAEVGGSARFIFGFYDAWVRVRSTSGTQQVVITTLRDTVGGGLGVVAHRVVADGLPSVADYCDDVLLWRNNNMVRTVRRHSNGNWITTQEIDLTNINGIGHVWRFLDKDDINLSLRTVYVPQLNSMTSPLTHDTYIIRVEPTESIPDFMSRSTPLPSHPATAKIPHLVPTDAFIYDGKLIFFASNHSVAIIPKRKRRDDT